MARLEQWELIGLTLVMGAAAFGIAYAAPALVTLTISFRGVAGFSASPQASLGIAGFALAALGSLAAIVVAQLRPAGKSAGGAVIIWTNFVVLGLGDLVFYLGNTQETIALLFGLASAVLTMAGLLVVSRREPRSGVAESR